MQDEARRRELAGFIRHRRGLVAPEALGFRGGRGRRTPGLRREELAAAAGVGLTWFTALEQAKPIRVSAAVLDNLARALGLTEVERRHLFALAHHRPPPLHAGQAGASDPTRLQAVLDAISLPAYARDALFTVRGWNAANTRTFGDFARIPEGERNVLRLLFTRGYHRRSMPGWEADARALVANFRLNAAEAIDPAPFRRLAAELAADSPAFRRLWEDQVVGEIGEGVTRFLSPRLGLCTFRHQRLDMPAMPGISLVLFLPAEG
ncbi:helix-turn-helix transcriptional regulator [Acidisoma sp. 7E03]